MLQWYILWDLSRFWISQPISELPIQPTLVVPLSLLHLWASCWRAAPALGIFHQLPLLQHLRGAIGWGWISTKLLLWSACAWYTLPAECQNREWNSVTRSQSEIPDSVIASRACPLTSKKLANLLWWLVGNFVAHSKASFTSPSAACRYVLIHECESGIECTTCKGSRTNSFSSSAWIRDTSPTGLSASLRRWEESYKKDVYPPDRSTLGNSSGLSFDPFKVARINMPTSSLCGKTRSFNSCDSM